MGLTDLLHPVEIAGWVVVVLSFVALLVFDVFNADVIVKFVAGPLILLGMILKQRD